MGLIDYNGSLHVHRTLLAFLRQAESKRDRGVIQGQDQ
jgi:hypothetical protein